MPEADPLSDAPSAGPKPTDEEVDSFGLTHPGKIRKENQDHFLLCSLHRQVVIHRTSLSTLDDLPLQNERLALLALVADGVGGGSRGEEASRAAVRQVTQYIVNTMRCYYTSDAAAENFVDALEDAALSTHAAIQARAQATPDLGGMATTLTLWLGVWPWVYVLQVGDSRYYLVRDGELTQITRDQTMSQDLVDQGILTRMGAFRTRWASVLSSAIGGKQTAPVVTRLPSDVRNVHLFRLFFTEKAENDKYARQLRSSAGVAVFVGRSACPAHWVAVGRAYQRFALLATSLGIRNAFVNQPIEVPSLREQFAQWLGMEDVRPDLVVRFVRGPQMPPSLRRPIDAVIGGARALRAGSGNAMREIARAAPHGRSACAWPYA